VTDRNGELPTTREMAGLLMDLGFEVSHSNRIEELQGLGVQCDKHDGCRYRLNPSRCNTACRWRRLPKLSISSSGNMPVCLREKKLEKGSNLFSLCMQSQLTAISARPLAAASSTSSSQHFDGSGNRTPILGQLRRSGHLAAFLNLVSHRDLRQFLRQKRVPWEFVQLNWESSFNDCGVFFGGFVVGAGESLTALVRLVAAFAGGYKLSEELAQEREQFLQAMQFLRSPEFVSLIRQFLDSPGDYVRTGLDTYRKTVEDHLWNLEFFEAGRVLGSTLAVILGAAQGLRRLPGLIKELATLLRTVAEVSVRQLRSLGVSLATLKDFLQSPARQLVWKTHPKQGIKGVGRRSRASRCHD
jgi:hypothetical protein